MESKAGILTKKKKIPEYSVCEPDWLWRMNLAQSGGLSRSETDCTIQWRWIYAFQLNCEFYVYEFTDIKDYKSKVGQ